MIRIRTLLSARRHALAALAAVIALGSAVALAHGVPAQEHMGGMGDSGTGQSAMVTMCMAIVEIGTVGVAVLGGWFLLRRRTSSLRRELGAAFTSACAAPPVRLPRARAGPAVLQVYRL